MDLTTLGALVVASLGLVFIAQLVYDRDLERAVERTAERSIGVITGAASLVVGALVIGVDWLLSMPELLITATGVGAVLSGINWQIYLTIAVLVWIVSMAAERRGSTF